MVKAIILTITFALIGEAIEVINQTWGAFREIISILPRFTYLFDYILRSVRGVVYIIFIIRALGIKEVPKFDMDEQVDKYMNE